MTLPDVVYVVRTGETNEELRFSLRSLANLPHGKVWIAGYCPRWVTGVGAIPTQVKPGGHVHAKTNLRAACEHPDVAESFVYMNDDFFVMQPHDELPVMHRGSLAEIIRSDRMASAYTRAMGKTLEILAEKGVTDPLMYDMHAPMTVTKTGMLEVLALCSAPMIQERTLFGNLNAVGGELRRNYKMRRGHDGWHTWPFLSTNDNTFRTLPVGDYVRSKFTEPSPYESGDAPRVTSPGRPYRAPPTRPLRRPVRYSASSTIRAVVRGAA